MNNLILNQNQITKLDTQLDFILLDGSGSMKDKWWDMLAALDNYVASLKTAKINSHIVLNTFCSRALDVKQRDTNIRDWKTFAEEPIGAYWGMTPLYDAIVIMVKTIRDLNPLRGCAITIVTDGGDTGDTFADVVQARAVLDWCRAQGWQVTFIGCDFNNNRQAEQLGANDTNSIGVQRKLLSAATKRYAEKRASYALHGTDINFTNDEKSQFGGYLNAPEAK